MPSNGVTLSALLNPNGRYTQLMLLKCVGPDVLLGIDERGSAEAGAFAAQTAEPALIIDGAERRLHIYWAFRSDYGWALGFYDTAAYTANPPDWTDAIAGAQSLLLDLPDGPIDLLALTTPEDRRAFSAGCAAERIGRGEGAPPLPPDADPAVLYYPTRFYRGDQMWQPTNVIPGTVTWSIEGTTGADARLVGTIEIPGAVTAILTVTRGADERTFRLAMEVGGPVRVGINNDLLDAPSGGFVARFYDEPGPPEDFPNNVTYDLADLFAIFDHTMLYAGGEALSFQSIAFATGPSGRERLAEARVLWAAAP